MTTDPILDKLEEIKYYSPERLLVFGREYADNEIYFDASIIFTKLSKFDKFRDVSELYKAAIISLSCANFRNLIKSNMMLDFVVKKSIYCMTESIRMHRENEISKKDLFTLERLIDRIPFKEMAFNNIEEFENIYCNFKEYNLKVFCENGKE